MVTDTATPPVENKSSSHLLQDLALVEGQGLYYTSYPQSDDGYLNILDLRPVPVENEGSPLDPVHQNIPAVQAATVAWPRPSNDLKAASDTTRSSSPHRAVSQQQQIRVAQIQALPLYISLELVTDLTESTTVGPIRRLIYKVMSSYSHVVPPYVQPLTCQTP